MEWIYGFRHAFLFPVGFSTMVIAMGYWSDHGRYPWKYWTRSEVIGFFSFGPAVGLLLTGMSMVASLATTSHPFVFERWFVAGSFLVFSIHLFFNRCNCTGRSEEENQRIRAEWEAVHQTI